MEFKQKQVGDAKQKGQRRVPFPMPTVCVGLRLKSTRFSGLQACRQAKSIEPPSASGSGTVPAGRSPSNPSHFDYQVVVTQWVEHTSGSPIF